MQEVKKMVESRREANKRKSRQKILKASRRLFKEKGYENTMIEDVAKRAEISKATLYNYFPNKDSLLVGTMDDVTEEFGKFVEEMDARLSIDEKIRKAMIFLILDSIPFISVSRRILFLNAYSDSPMYGKANDVKEMLEELVVQAKSENVFSKEIPTKAIVDQLLGVYLISQFEWMDIEDIEHEECVERIERLIDLTMAGCYA